MRRPINSSKLAGPSWRSDPARRRIRRRKPPLRNASLRDASAVQSPEGVTDRSGEDPGSSAPPDGPDNRGRYTPLDLHHAGAALLDFGAPVGGLPSRDLWRGVMVVPVHNRPTLIRRDKPEEPCGTSGHRHWIPPPCGGFLRELHRIPFAMKIKMACVPNSLRNESPVRGGHHDRTLRWS